MISGLRMCLAWREGCESTVTEGGTTIAECVELHHHMNSMGFPKTAVVQCLDILMSEKKPRWKYNDDKTAVVIVDERLVVLTVSSPSQSEEFTFELIHKTLGDFVTNKFHMAGERMWRLSYDNASKANGAIDVLTSAGYTVDVEPYRPQFGFDDSVQITNFVQMLQTHIIGLQFELQAVTENTDATSKERDTALKERDTALKERDTALKERDMALKERDGKRRDRKRDQRDRNRDQKRDEERDQERDQKRDQERDQKRDQEHDQKREHERGQELGRVWMLHTSTLSLHKQAVKQRDTAVEERDAAVEERDAAVVERDAEAAAAAGSGVLAGTLASRNLELLTDHEELTKKHADLVLEMDAALLKLKKRTDTTRRKTGGKKKLCDDKAQDDVLDQFLSSDQKRLEDENKALHADNEIMLATLHEISTFQLMDEFEPLLRHSKKGKKKVDLKLDVLCMALQHGLQNLKKTAYDDVKELSNVFCTKIYMEPFDGKVSLRKLIDLVRKSQELEPLSDISKANIMSLSSVIAHRVSTASGCPNRFSYVNTTIASDLSSAHENREAPKIKQSVGDHDVVCARNAPDTLSKNGVLFRIVNYVGEDKVDVVRKKDEGRTLTFFTDEVEFCVDDPDMRVEIPKTARKILVQCERGFLSMRHTDEHGGLWIGKLLTGTTALRLYDGSRFVPKITMDLKLVDLHSTFTKHFADAFLGDMAWVIASALNVMCTSTWKVATTHQPMSLLYGVFSWIMMDVNQFKGGFTTDDKARCLPLVSQRFIHHVSAAIEGGEKERDNEDWFATLDRCVFKDVVFTAKHVRIAEINRLLGEKVLSADDDLLSAYLFSFLD